jgi:4-hydroxybenzoate polyprenyltransferase
MSSVRASVPELTGAPAVEEVAASGSRLRWLRAWAAERFPARNGAFFIMLYAVVVVASRSVVSGGPIVLSWRDALGLLALWCFFLTLRVLDEHKDFAADAVAHPDRVLQRGLITLADLRIVGAVAVAIQLGVAILFDGGFGAVTLRWLAAAGFSALMAKEFFVREWLRKHLVAYALSHMLVMPLLVLWLAAMGGLTSIGSPENGALALLVFFAGLSFEIARKMRAPEDERPMADTYTSALGVRRASQLLLVVVAATMLASLAALRELTGQLPVVTLRVAVALMLLAALALWRFRERPTSRKAKIVEASVGVVMLVAHGLILYAVLAVRGVAFR